MVRWAVPRNLKELRGFLGLTEYYRRFVKGYGHIAGPLIQYLKKNSFKWSVEIEEAFNILKQAMVTVPVLALSDFNQPFYLEIDVSAYRWCSVNAIGQTNLLLQPNNLN